MGERAQYATLLFDVVRLLCKFLIRRGCFDNYFLVCNEGYCRGDAIRYDFCLARKLTQ